MLLGDFLKAFEDIMYLEKFTESKGMLQKINALIKLLSLTAILLSAVVSRSIYSLFALFVIVISLSTLSRIPLGYLLRRVTLFIPVFAAAIVSPLLFITPGSTVAHINLGPLIVQVTIEGIEKASIFTFRIWICVAALNLLILTTKFTQIIQSMEELGLPRIFINMIAITYRFIFLFINEAYRMILAKQSRTTRKESRIQHLRFITNMFSTLFLRAYEKGERVYSAMLARGFNGVTRAHNHNKRKPTDSLFLFAVFSICGLILSIEILRSAGW